MCVSVCAYVPMSVKYTHVEVRNAAALSSLDVYVRHLMWELNWGPL